VRWKLLTHLRSHPLNPPGCAAPLGRDDAVGLQHLADMLMMALTIELGIGQDQANREPLVGGVDQGAQGGTIVRGAAAGRLGQNYTGVDIHGHGPRQPVAPGEPLASILRSLDEEGADGPRREAGRVHGHRHPSAGLEGQPSDDGAQDLLQRRLIEPTEQAVHGGIVGHVLQS